MNEKLLNRQIECYEEYLQLLEIAKEVVLEAHGKSFSKRVLTKLESKTKEKSLPFHIYQSNLFSSESGGKVSIGVINRNRLVDNYYLSDYEFNFYISFSTNKIIDKDSTLESIDIRIENMNKNIEKFKSTMEQYEALKESKKQIEEMISKHNAKVHYLFQELRVK